MFRVEPHQLLYIYAATGVALIFLAALLHTIRRVRREREGLSGVAKCGMCAFRFRDRTGMVHPRCPQCGALVERRRHSAL
jgi:predicted Zn-ribbon and HTH transcriptional regulator